MDNYRIIKNMEDIKKAKLEENNKILKMALALSMDDKDDKNLYEAFTDHLAPSLFYNTIFPNEFEDPGEKADGPIKVTDNFGLDLKEVGQGGLLICGESGSGKTTLNYKILIEADKRGGKFWAFDVKNDYSGLFNYIPEIYYFSPNNFKRNMLQPPPGVPLSVHRDSFCSLFCREEGILVASKNFLLEQLDKTYREFGSYKGGPFPAVYDLKETVFNAKCAPYSVTLQYKDRILNRLKGLLIALGDYLDCSEGYDLVPLMNKNIVWQLTGLEMTYQRICALDLMTFCFNYRMFNNIRGVY